MPRQPSGTGALTMMCTYPPSFLAAIVHNSEPIRGSIVLLSSSSQGLPTTEWNFGMCNACERLDEKIEHYKKVMSAMTDRLTIERIAVLVAELEAQKAKLHREQK
jgi:hypothetical protein